MDGFWKVCVILAMTACAGDPGGSAADGTAAVPLAPMPPRMLAKCVRFEALRPACPPLAPEVDDSQFERAHASPREQGVWIFFAEWNAPHRGLTAKNAPPRFAHVNVFAGDLSEVMPWEVQPRGDATPGDRRRVAVSFGARTWNGRVGELVLAPSFPAGGIEGDHLVFAWAESGRDYSVSLHAWQPLDETEATLEAVVASLP